MKNFIPETMGKDWNPATPPPSPPKCRARPIVTGNTGAPSRFEKFAPEKLAVLPDGCSGDLEVKSSYERVHDAIPTSEWSPTIGQPEAANSEPYIHTPAEAAKAMEVMFGWASPADARIVDCDTGEVIQAGGSHYTTLSAILDAAFNHAATGKGKERHARDLPFDDQPIMQTTRLVGPGFPLGQAIKKAGEAAGMIERGELSAAEAECLGAINYLAGAVAWMREQGREGKVMA